MREKEWDRVTAYTMSIQKPRRKYVVRGGGRGEEEEEEEFEDNSVVGIYDSNHLVSDSGIYPICYYLKSPKRKRGRRIKARRWSKEEKAPSPY